jgi:hypothetical protein
MNRAKNTQIFANLVQSFLQSCSVYAGALPSRYAVSKPRLWALAIADPTIRKNLLHIAGEPVGGTPEQLERLFQQDHAKYGRLVKELGIKAAEN